MSLCIEWTYLSFGALDLDIEENDGDILNLEVSFDLGPSGKVPVYSESIDLCEKLNCPVK